MRVLCVCALSNASDAVNDRRHRQLLLSSTHQPTTLIIDLWTFLKKRHFEHISICMTSHCNVRNMLMHVCVFRLSVRACAFHVYRDDSDGDGVSANAYACSYVHFCFRFASLSFSCSSVAVTYQINVHFYLKIQKVIDGVLVLNTIVCRCFVYVVHVCRKQNAVLLRFIAYTHLHAQTHSRLEIRPIHLTFSIK